jgi:crotonobetainyl-CoA:carnitine CoA-transferase CaiB-like acyl-CoA transferase
MILSLVAVVAALAMVPSTSSAAYLSVYVTPSATGFCTPSAGRLSYQLAFRAKVKAIGTTKPSRVRIGYKVADQNTGAVLRSGVLNLKKSSRYRGKSKRITADAGQQLYYYLNMSYKAYGKTRKAKTRSTDSIPPLEQLVSLDIPAC